MTLLPPVAVNACEADGSARRTPHIRRYVIADRLSRSGWSWGCVAVVNTEGRGIFVVDAHRDDGKRYVVRADEKLTAFLEIEKVTRDASESVKEKPRARDPKRRFV